jgi:2-polyprenyl-6-hydroxyphenyl methylase/3-demethylubiquinone-9 3-methyltransferase
VTTLLTYDECVAAFDARGGTDIPYLRNHFERFRQTLLEFDRTWDRNRGVRLLDVGAHWLHQSLLWRRAGYQVTAMDLPVTMELSCVQTLARAEQIELIASPDLERADALAQFPDDRFEVIIFAEIIEHLTFNPVQFWKQIYRVLAPGGRIVITTPNYYSWNGRMWDMGRWLTGFGGGISVDEVLATHTYGHHWREFSRKELIRYFCLLSPDFNTIKAKTMRNYYASPDRRSRRVIQAIFEMFPGLRPNLHLEIELANKSGGIVVQPHR